MNLLDLGAKIVRLGEVDSVIILIIVLYSILFFVNYFFYNQVCLLVRVFRCMRLFAIEKGGHSNACTGALELKDRVVNNTEGKDLLFNPNDYKSRYQVLCII